MKAMKAKKAETILADGASAPTVRTHSYGDESVVMEMGNQGGVTKPASTNESHSTIMTITVITMGSSLITAY